MQFLDFPKCTLLVLVGACLFAGPATAFQQENSPLLQFAIASIEENAARFTKPGKVVYEYELEAINPNGTRREKATIELYWKGETCRSNYRGYTEVHQKALPEKKLPRYDNKREFVLDALIEPGAVIAHTPSVGKVGTLYAVPRSQILQIPKFTELDVSPQNLCRKPAPHANATFARSLTTDTISEGVVENRVVNMDNERERIIYNCTIKYPSSEAYEVTREIDANTGFVVHSISKPTEKRSGIVHSWRWAYKDSVNAYVLEESQQSGLPKVGQQSWGQHRTTFTLKSIELTPDVPDSMFDRNTLLKKKYSDVKNFLPNQIIKPTLPLDEEEGKANPKGTNVRNDLRPGT